MQGEHAIDMRSDGHFITSFVAALFLGVGARIRAAAGTLGLLLSRPPALVSCLWCVCVLRCVAVCGVCAWVARGGVAFADSLPGDWRGGVGVA